MKTKRILSLTLVFLLIFSNLVYADLINDKQYSSKLVQNTTNTSNPMQKYIDMSREAKKANQQMLFDSRQKFNNTEAEENQPQYKPEDKVRVIVELDGQAVSTKLTEANKLAVSSLKNAQQAVMTQIEDNGIDIAARHQFVQGINGFSAEITYKDMEQINNTPGVKKVHIANKYKPDMTYSSEIVNADDVQNIAGLKGEGTLVAIVDTGLDYTHADFAADPVSPKYTSETIKDDLFLTLDVSDVFYTNKVPTGYDWADDDSDVIPDMSIPTSSTHGTHVAGTVAANGIIKGIAPEAQLLAEKVFSDNSPYAYSDDIIAGILHAINMDADVINMSLGSVSGFVNPNDPEQYAVKLAVDAGIVVAVSAGNSAYSTNGYYYPFAENYDTGLVGSPSTGLDTLSVASYENTHITSNVLDYLFDGIEAGDKIAYANAGNMPISTVEGVEMVYCGLGSSPADFPSSVAGKIALVSRGVSPFAVKQENAQNAGAAAIIVFNNSSGGDTLLSMATYEQLSIPAIFVGNTAGTAMQNAIAEGKAVTMRLDGSVSVVNPNAGKMSDFTSWGLTPDLEFKPEITAPGGNIYSTVVGGGYDNMSGTSMAAPHVAGAAALVAQYLKTLGYPEDRTLAEQAKIMLMNTSQVVIDGNGVPYSPRRQGAGLMQIDKAITSPVSVTTTNNKASISLKEIDTTTKQATFTLTLKSSADMPISYDVYADILTDKTITDTYGYNILLMEDAFVNDATISVNGAPISDTEPPTLTVGADASLNFDIVLDLNGSTLPTEKFVEGFIRLVPSSTIPDVPALTIPYVGFYGDWDTAKVVDTGIWEASSYTGFTGLYEPILLSIFGDTYQYGQDLEGNVDQSKAAFSPNNDGWQDGTSIAWTQLRNAKSLKVYVEKDSVKVVDILDTATYEEDGVKVLEEGMRKHALTGSILNDTYSMNWFGENSNMETLPDGNYDVVIESTIDFPGATAQKYVMPVIIDTVAPTVEGITVTPVGDGTYTVSWTTADANSGVLDSYVFLDGAPYDTDDDGAADSLGVNSITVDQAPSSVVVTTYDYAGNSSYAYIGNPVVIESEIIESVTIDQTNISVNRPAEISISADRAVDWTVTVLNPQGQLVDTLVNEYGTSSSFYAQWAPVDATVQSGVYTLNITVKDAANNTSSVATIFTVYNYEMKVKASSVADANGIGKAIFAKGEVVNVNAQIENLGLLKENAMLIVLTFDPSNTVVNIGYVKVTDFEENTAMTLNSGFCLSNTAAVGEYTVKAFVWDGYESMNALSSEIILHFTVN